MVAEGMGPDVTVVSGPAVEVTVTVPLYVKSGPPYTGDSNTARALGALTDLFKTLVSVLV